MDEFGKGTSPVDALSLLASTIEHFCEQTQKCRCLFALHYTEVLTPGLISEHALHQILTFRMSTHDVPGEDGPGADAAEPMFKLEVGTAPSSYGLQCARIAGVVPALVDRAAEVRSCLQGSKDIRPASTLLTRNQPHQGSVHSELNQQVLRKFFSVRDWTSEEEAQESDLQELLTLCRQALQARSR